MRLRIVSTHRRPEDPKLDRATARALNAINLDFYRRCAAEFSATRRSSWAGWRGFERWLPARRPLRTLDVACGNGRFARHLCERGIALEYVGIDASPELLAIARAETRDLGCEFLGGDLCEKDFADGLGARRFDLIGAFGILHHLPGRDTRQRMLQQLLPRLAPEGILVFTRWRLLALAPQRLRPWPTGSGADTLLRIDAAQIGSRDHLLAWGHGDEQRYCHAVDDAEIEALIRVLPARLVARYRADGRQGDANEYFVWKACP